MTTQKLLFHGTNEEYWDHFFNSIYVPYYWTTSPFAALQYAQKRAKQYYSGMLVCCISDWSEENFAHTLQTRDSFRKDIQEYRIKISPWLKNVEAKHQMVEVYRKADLAKFIEKHFNEEEKDWAAVTGFIFLLKR